MLSIKIILTSIIISGCGGLLKEPTGEFTSPGYPNHYPVGKVCEWHIKADYGSNIVLTILEVDIEFGQNCKYDGLIISNTRDFENHTLARLCYNHNNETVITSSGHEMYVKFQSDYSRTGKGFAAKYSTKINGKFEFRSFERDT